MKFLLPGDRSEKYILRECIKSNGIAEVWYADHFHTVGAPTVLKFYTTKSIRFEERILLRDEIQSNSNLIHPNLLPCGLVDFDSRFDCLSLNYCENGSVDNRDDRLNAYDIIKLIFDISSPLDYLHSIDKVHQNIKPSNIFGSTKDRYLLSDFGFSNSIRKALGRNRTRIVIKGIEIDSVGITRPGYMAPELFDLDYLDQPPIKASDIWAFGACLFELATGQLPFGVYGGSKQVDNIVLPIIPSSYHSELNSIIEKCLSLNPWDRPKAKELNAWSKKLLDFEELFINIKPTIPIYN